MSSKRRQRPLKGARCKWCGLPVIGDGTELHHDAPLHDLLLACVSQQVSSTHRPFADAPTIAPTSHGMTDAPRPLDSKKHEPEKLALCKPDTVETSFHRSRTSDTDAGMRPDSHRSCCRAVAGSWTV